MMKRKGMRYGLGLRLFGYVSCRISSILAYATALYRPRRLIIEGEGKYLIRAIVDDILEALAGSRGHGIMSYGVAGCNSFLSPKTHYHAKELVRYDLIDRDVLYMAIRHYIEGVFRGKISIDSISVRSWVIGVHDEAIDPDLAVYKLDLDFTSKCHNAIATLYPDKILLGCYVMVVEVVCDGQKKTYAYTAPLYED